MADRNHPPVRLPDRRRLRTFAFDPMSTRLSGRLLPVDVPFEHTLRPGPIGELLHVVDYDAARGVWYEPVDLDDPAILAQDGLRPSEGDPRTHQQVVYAVSMSVIERFERFLGRRFRWREDRTLRLVPHAFEGRNAYFDPVRRAVLFGYYRADRRDPGANLPGQVMFTCLSSDIVAHEVTHAIVHRLRRHFSEATNPDVFAWHEAFADLVALFQHFVHRDVVVDALTASHGDLGHNKTLLDLADEFGKSIGRGAALRSAIAEPPNPDRFRTATEPHERGACFVAAVFDAFLETYQARIADLLRIATGGTGVLPAGNLHPDLVNRVADEAVYSADRMLAMVVRAFDYLPVVDVTFGDVVRAIVTADRSLHPGDEAHLRSRLVETLRRRGIYPARVASLTDEALAWPRPPAGLRLDVEIAQVILSATKDLDPTGEAGLDISEDVDLGPAFHTSEIAPACVAWATAHAYELGLDPHPDQRIAVHGIHVTYRQAADKQPRPELVLQFTQRRQDLEDGTASPETRAAMRAGTVLIASVDGRVDHVVAKPLPFVDPAAVDLLPDAIRDTARGHQDAGVDRLAAIRQWYDDLTGRDALSAWTPAPAVQRLTFAKLHANGDAS